MDNGGPSATSSVPPADSLHESLYRELHDIARRERRRAGPQQTLQTTALISEAYLKLYRRDGWADQGHFLASAATAMRHVLVDAARARVAAKRSAPAPADDMPEDDDVTLVALDAALRALAERDPQLAKLVECRFFAGMTEAETAGVLGVTDRTVRRWWLQARAWIHREMSAS